MTTIFSTRIVITAAAGFLGSHLCARLLADANEEVCLDNVCCGTEANIAPLIRHPKFKILRGDVIESCSFDGDIIYNIACLASPAHYTRRCTDIACAKPGLNWEPKVNQEDGRHSTIDHCRKHLRA